MAGTAALLLIGGGLRAAEALRGAGYTNVKNAGGFLSVGDTRSGARYV